VPTRLEQAARDRAYAALARILGPRAAASIASGATSLNPLTHLRTAGMRVQAFAARRGTPITAVAGGVAATGMWRGMMVAASTVTEVTTRFRV
jgi:hypothetical protein